MCSLQSKHEFQVFLNLLEVDTLELDPFSSPFFDGNVKPTTYCPEIINPLVEKMRTDASLLFHAVATKK
jgi:5-methylthioribose kinase